MAGRPQRATAGALAQVVAARGHDVERRSAQRSSRRARRALAAAKSRTSADAGWTATKQRRHMMAWLTLLSWRWLCGQPLPRYCGSTVCHSGPSSSATTSRVGAYGQAVLTTVQVPCSRSPGRQHGSAPPRGCATRLGRVARWGALWRHLRLAALRI